MGKNITPQNNIAFSEHWDSVRGISMILFMLININGLLEIKLLGNIELLLFPTIEPIIFLSGFLICMRCRQYIQFSGASIQKILKFYILRRIVRTWPMYFFLIALCFTFPSIVEKPITKSLSSFLTFTMNYDLHSNSGLRSLWTLCIEEWCYFLFIPLIPFLKSKKIIFIFILLIGISVSGRIFHTYNEGILDRSRYFSLLHFQTHLHWSAFWLGSITGFYYNANITKKWGKLLLFFVPLNILLFAYIKSTATNYWILAILQSFSPFWGSLLAYCMIYGIPTIPSKWLKISGIAAMGYISYTLYLTHKIIAYNFLQLNLTYNWVPQNSWLEFILSLIMVVIIGGSLFFISERFILNYLRNHWRLSKS